MKRILFVTWSFLISFSCKNAVQPNPPNGPDTTSHAIAWQVDTLGDGASSVLYDVAIINDTLAYAVGEMYLRDSTGQIDPIAYSVATWNGSGWRLRRLSYSVNSLIVAIRGIFAFGPNDVWLAAGSVFHWNGISSQTQLSFSRLTLPDPNATIEKLWGSTNSSLFGVGNAGTIVLNNASTWQRLESGTATNINDIWGTVEQSNGRKTILLAVSNRYSPGEKKLLSIDPTSRVDTLSWSPGSRLNTVWFASSSKIFVGGSGLYVGVPGVWQQIFDLPSYYITRIRGTATNDVWVVGAYGLCAHFNGDTWKTYPEVALLNGSYEGLAVSNKLIIAVGYVGNRAVVLRGRR